MSGEDGMQGERNRVRCAKGRYTRIESEFAIRHGPSERSEDRTYFSAKSWYAMATMRGCKGDRATEVF